MTNLSLDGPHWSFALGLYGRPSVSEACLALQDRLGVDVNVLLVAVCAAVDRGIAISEDDVADMDRAVAHWRGEVVTPLRAIRRRMKTGPDPAPCQPTEAVRGQVKRAELAAEQVEQAVLARWLEQRPGAVQPGKADVAAVVSHVVAYYRARCGEGLETAAGWDARNAMDVVIRAASTMRAGPVPGEV